MLSITVINNNNIIIDNKAHKFCNNLYCNTAQGIKKFLRIQKYENTLRDACFIRKARHN